MNSVSLNDLVKIINNQRMFDIHTETIQSRVGLRITLISQNNNNNTM